MKKTCRRCGAEFEAADHRRRNCDSCREAAAERQRVQDEKSRAYRERQEKFDHQGHREALQWVECHGDCRPGPHRHYRCLADGEEWLWRLPDDLILGAGSCSPNYSSSPPEPTAAYVAEGLEEIERFVNSDGAVA